MTVNSEPGIHFRGARTNDCFEFIALAGQRQLSVS